MKKRFSVAIIILVPLTFAGVVFWEFKKATSPPSCHRDTCINRDARDEQCDKDVETSMKQEFKEATLTLRYSATCNTSWARAVVPIGSILYVEDVRGRKYGEFQLFDDGVATEHYGNMGPGRALKACVQLPDGKDLCTKLAPD